MKTLLLNQTTDRKDLKSSAGRQWTRLEALEINAVRDQVYARTRFLNGSCDIAVARDDACSSFGPYAELAATDLPRVFCVNAKTRWQT